MHLYYHIHRYMFTIQHRHNTHTTQAQHTYNTDTTQAQHAINTGTTQAHRTVNTRSTPIQHTDNTHPIKTRIYTRLHVDSNIYTRYDSRYRCTRLQ